MRTIIEVKDQEVINKLPLKNGKYEVEIREKELSKTYEQVKKLWATIDAISIHENGNTIESQNIYFKILQMSGVQTYKIPILEEAVDDLRKKVRTLVVIGTELIDHKVYAICNVCLKGISEMSKKEVSKVIETCVMYASNLGIESDLEKWK